ncbi:hypothetical protein [Bacillus sinesaloumensis]|nr:hypothetical protein [Bacillus sinesaloumensis]
MIEKKIFVGNYKVGVGDTLELKGTKSEVYEAIKREIRTKKRGKAFLKYV